MPNFRKGTAALEEHEKKAAERGSGNFKQFAPFFGWPDNGSEHHLLFLNQWEDMPQVEYIGFIPMKGTKQNGDTYTYQEAVIARTDPAIAEETGETVDPLVRDLDAKPKTSHIAVAVELEPTWEEVEVQRGKSTRTVKQVTGFEVVTETFERRVRDEKGDLTDEREEVTQPVVGFVVQSPANFFNVVASFDSTKGPIHEVPVTVTRVGAKGSNSTTYTLDGHDGVELDLSGLVDYFDNISYLDKETMGDLETAVDDAEDELAAANVIGDWLLDQRLEELCDKERYDEIANNTVATTLDKFGGGKGGKGKGKSSDEPRASKPRRARQRKSETAEEPVATEEPKAVEEPTPEVEPDPGDVAVDVDGGEDNKARIKRLRDQAQKRRAGAKATA